MANEINSRITYEKEPASTVEVTEDELRRDGRRSSVFRRLLAEVDGAASASRCSFITTHVAGPLHLPRDLYVEEAAAARHRDFILKTVAAIATPTSSLSRL